jgi:hypothetical protein
MKILRNQVDALERALKNYEKAFRDADKALEHYKRADADLELSRAEVEYIANTSFFSQMETTFEYSLASGEVCR